MTDNLIDTSPEKLEQHILTKPITNRVILTNKDFINGTYRIIMSGEYILSENIIFAPNKSNDGKPTKTQLELLPKGFILGFFAAITIETDSVILNLNNYSISQSKLFSIQQPFYSHIELADSPFIFKQGPSDFPQNTHFASHTIIKDGILDLSSHHGIHGNMCNNIIIKDLIIKNFGVAAIAINGGNNMLLRDLTIDNKNIEILFNSLLSHALFLKPFLVKIAESLPDTLIELANSKSTIQNIIDNLENEVELAIKHIDDIDNYHGIFKNVCHTYDANMYGIVFNTAGVVVNDFKPLRHNQSIGNTNIVLENINILNIESQGTEIKLLSNINTLSQKQGYGTGVFRGPVGDVFDWVKCMDFHGRYKGNCVSDAQLCIALYGTKEEKGTTDIPDYIINWAKSNILSIIDIIKTNKLTIIKGRDSMGHIMKGNIGLFISQGENIKINNLNIDGINNTSISDTKKVACSYGILLTGSKKIIFSNYSIKNITSKKGDAVNIIKKNENNNIRFNN